MTARFFLQRSILLLLFIILNSYASIGVSSTRHYYSEDSDESSESRYGHSRQASRFSEGPDRIALLLPFSGQHAQAARAIREGFFAAYYDAARQNSEKTMIRVYDTTREKDIRNLYDTAVSEGANFVVGPLSKEDVLRLSILPPSALHAPVLALNHHPEARSSRQFFQYSLAPETEAEQLADKAWQKGYRKASIIVPDNAWGKRTASAFSSEWQRHGGRILQTVYISPQHDQSAAVRRLLGIDESQKRAEHIKGLLNSKVEFQPKRRQDLDVIFMAAPPDQARQLKPLFDFYYAEDVPVYATSSVYSGHPNPKRDRDLNGVTFCDMPWLLNENRAHTIQGLLKHAGPNQSDQYKRLFAMGVDAFELSQHLSYLESNPNGQIQGVTGNLHLIQGNFIERTLIFAKFVNGVPVLLH